MKHFTGFIILLLIIAGSCNKDEVPVPVSLAGSWMWVYTWNDGAPGPTNPMTPQIAGYEEQLILNSDYSWSKSTFNATTEPIPLNGTFSMGHGSYTPYKGAYVFNYDSLVFHKTGNYNDLTVEYYQVSNDTLIFSTGFRGVSGGGSKTYIKQ